MSLYIERFPEQARPVKGFFDNPHAALDALKVASMFGLTQALYDAMEEALRTGQAIDDWTVFDPPKPADPRKGRTADAEYLPRDPGPT